MGLLKALPLQRSSETLLPTDEDLPMLLHGLRDPDPELRRMAARDLGQYAQAAHALAAQLNVEGDRHVAEAILHALGHIGSAEAVAVLLPFLRSERANIRNETIEVLKGLPDSVAPAMAGLLSDVDPDVRIFAVNVLESLRHPMVVDWLLDVIEDDDHVNVVATALDLLAEVGDERCLPALAQVAQRFWDEPYLQFVVNMARDRIMEGKGEPT